MRARLVVGNWKMNPPTIEDAVELARAVAALPRSSAKLGIAPPAVALAAVADAVRGRDLAVFAQDVHWEEKGAFTGQISATMVRGLAEGAIVGHSEVRRDQGDDDARVARKLARAVAAGLRPILCVGESEAEFVAGESTNVVARQISADLAALVRGSVGSSSRTSRSGRSERAVPPQARMRPPRRARSARRFVGWTSTPTPFRCSTAEA